MAQTLTHDILTAALAGFKFEQQQLEEKIAHVQSMLDGTTADTSRPASAAATTGPAVGKRKKRSAAVRKRMAEAQKARWAKLKGESEPAPEAATVKTAKPKRKLSEAGRKAIVDAVKKRWAAKKTTPKAAAPKKAARKAAAKAKKKAPAAVPAAEASA